MTSAFFGDIELQTQEQSKAKEFYERLFGWKMDELELPGLGRRIEIKIPQGPSGSIMPGRSGQPAAWTPYLNVADLTATVAKVRELGGKVYQEPLEVPGEGALAVVADPTGAVFKLWQAKHA